MRAIFQFKKPLDPVVIYTVNIKNFAAFPSGCKLKIENSSYRWVLHVEFEKVLIWYLDNARLANVYDNDRTYEDFKA